MAMTLNSEEQNRVNNVYNEREKALAENNSMYEGLINNAGEMRDQQNQFLSQQEEIQNANLDKQLDYQKGIIDQQKQEASRNKAVEEKKALNDYTAYTNPYGLQNERLYGAGLGNSGVSETSKLGAYTTMQTRVAAGNAAYQKAVQEYDNAFNQAVLNNDVQKAENALNKLKLQLQNNQDYYTNVASLSQNKLKNQQDLQATYMDQYNNVYNQIMSEQKQAEAIRQYNESLAEQRRQYDANMAYQRERDAVKDAQWQKEYEIAKKNASKSGGSGGSQVKLTSGSPNGNNWFKDTFNDIKNTVSDNKELYAYSSPTGLSKSGLNWFTDEFEKHSYKYKDLRNVLTDAVSKKKISQADANKIYASYGIK